MSPSWNCAAMVRVKLWKSPRVGRCWIRIHRIFFLFDRQQIQAPYRWGDADILEKTENNYMNTIL